MISYSLSFGVRARCKYCMSGPKYISCLYSGTIFKDILNLLQKSIEYQSKKINVRSGIASVNYLFIPNRMLKLTHTSMSVAYASCDVKRYKNLLPKKETNKRLFKTSYSCECFKTTWVTRDIVILDKNHISEHLSFKCYPSDIIPV